MHCSMKNQPLKVFLTYIKIRISLWDAFLILVSLLQSSSLWRSLLLLHFFFIPFFLAICLKCHKIDNFCFREPITELKVHYKNNTDGRISVEAIGVLDIEKLQLPIILQCEVIIPEANYSSMQEYIYNGNEYNLIYQIFYSELYTNA